MADRAGRPPPSLRLDPHVSTFVTILGKKGSGKSVLARWFWDAYPFDRMVIDPTADADPGDGTELLDDPLPARWPQPFERDERSSVRYVPDPGSATYADDLDRAVGLAFYHRRCLLWIDEIAELTKANQTPPHFRRALHQGRHRQLSLLMCGPRSIDVNPLVLSQADLLIVFAMPHPHDQDRVAATIGWRPADLAAAVNGLGRFEFLCWFAADDELVHFPALPLSARRPPAPPDDSALPAV